MILAVEVICKEINCFDPELYLLDLGELVLGQTGLVSIGELIDFLPRPNLLLFFQG